MRSIRLEDRLARATELAAAREGVSVSEFIRRAIAARVDRESAEQAPWLRFAGCASSSDHARSAGGGDGSFSAAVDAKFARIERERASRRAARDAR